MHTRRKASGIIIASAAAALFTAGAVGAVSTATPASAADGVKCFGVNSCKGSGECKTAENACKGQNVCKGHGFITTKTAAECAAKGGKTS